MADGGSITLRVSLAGAPEVKAALASLGPAGAQALRQIEEAQRGRSAGMLALNAAGKDLNAGLLGLSGNAGTFGNALSAVGPAGLAAAAGIGAAIAAGAALIAATKSAMNFAEALETSAKAAGVAVTTLQTYRYAGDQAGVSIEGVDGALKGFTATLGQAEAGQQRALKTFQALGFTQDQLKSFSSVDAALDAVVDKVSSLGNAAETAGLAKKLGMSELTPLLEEGAAKIAALRTEAVNLGVVMDGNVVKSLADAERGFKSASSVIDVQFKSALVDIAPLLVDAIKLIAEAARALNDFLNNFKAVQNRSTQALRDDEAGIATHISQLVPQIKAGDPAAQTLVNTLTGRSQANIAELKRRAAMDSGTPNNNLPTTVDLSKTPRAKAAKPDDFSALEGSASQGLDAANAALATATAALTGDIQAHADLEEKAIDADLAKQQDKLAAETAKIEADKTLTAEERKQLLGQVQATAAVDQQVTDAKKAKLDRDTVAALNAKQLADQQAVDVYYQQISSITAGMALTQAARYAIEKANLAREQFLQAQALRNENQQGLAAGTRSQSQADALSASQGDLFKAQQAQLSQQFLGPLDAWVLAAKKATMDVTVDFQNIEVDGLNAFNNSLFDSEGRIQSFGTIAHNVLVKVLTDLEQLVLKQAEVSLFGGSGGGGFNILSIFGIGNAAATVGASSATMAASSIPADLAGLFADGGMIMGPGGPRSDNILAMVSPGEFIVNAQAAQRFAPILHALNDNKIAAIPRFASGGSVGGAFGANGIRMGGDTYVWQVDNRIFADGADPAQLGRVAANQEAILKDEPRRVAQYVAAMRKARII